jgi:hypothetical protein
VIGDYIEGICSLGIGPTAEWKGGEYTCNLNEFSNYWSVRGSFEYFVSEANRRKAKPLL